MTTLLRIDASVRVSGSQSRAIADRLQARWSAAHAKGRVVVRDLASNPPPHLDQHTAAVLGRRSQASAPLSDQLIDELKAATDLLISSPLYNLGVPSTLKAWFDHVVRADHTFRLRADGSYEPLLQGRMAYLVLARGGPAPQNASDDFQTPYLKSILRFIGWPFTEVIQVAGTSLPQAVRDAHLEAAMLRINTLFPDPQALQTSESPAVPEHPEANIRWVGEAAPPAELQQEIAELRRAQCQAILAADAEAYARLCTEDVCLMLPGRPPIQGRAAFLRCERELLKSAPVRRFEKYPFQVLLDQGTAVETGLQLVESASSNSGVFAPKQKYTHVMRRTEHGLRFAVLTSNASE